MTGWKYIWSALLHRATINNSVYGAVIMTMVTGSTRVHPVHVMHADWAPGGLQPSGQANWLGLWIHHRHLSLLLSPKANTHFSLPRHCRKGVQPVLKAVHRSSCHYEHNCPRPLTPQSIMPSLVHCKCKLEASFLIFIFINFNQKVSLRTLWCDVKVLQHVRLPLMSPKFLVGTVGSDLLVKSDDMCRDLVDEAKNYLLLPQERPQMQGPRTRPRKPIRCGEVLFAGQLQIKLF